jgi:hypothetical protein
MLVLRILHFALYAALLSCLACQEPGTKDDTGAGTAANSSTSDVTLDIDVTGSDAQPSQTVCTNLLDSCLNEQNACTVSPEGEESCTPCPKGSYSASPEAQCVPIDGKAIVHDFAEMTLAPGEEINSVCQTWILNNPEELWVHAVEFENGGGYHHSNWIFVPEGYNGWKTEPWPNCYAEGFSEGVAGLIGGVLFAQSTQAEEELQKFKSGAALRIPPYSQIMAPTHLLNYNPQALTTHLRLTIYTIPSSEVTTKLTPIVLTNRALALPKKSTSEFKAHCDFNDTHEIFLGAPLDAKLHYALPHYHDRAINFRLSIYGGERDGELIFEDDGYGLEPFGRRFDPPIDLAGSKGLTFSCIYKNESNKKIKWGIGDREMCDMLGFVESPASLIGYVDGGKIQQLDDGSYLHEGNCAASSVEFDQSKDGGDPQSP